MCVMNWPATSRAGFDAGAAWSSMRCLGLLESRAEEGATSVRKHKLAGQFIAGKSLMKLK